MTPPPSHDANDAVHPPVAAHSALSAESGVVPISTEHGWVPPPERRGGRSGAVVGWVLGLSVAALVIGGGALVHTNANLAFDDALAAARDAATDARAAQEEVADAAEESAAEVGAAESIIAVAGDDLVDPAARTVFADATAANAAEVSAAQTLVAEPIPTPDDEKPLWTWELFEAVPGFASQTDSLDDLTSDLVAADAALDTADAALEIAADPLYSSIEGAADALEAANVSARNAVVIAFRAAADAAAQRTMIDPASARAFADYAAKAAELKASAQAQLEAKSGPLSASRLEVESFARSIAGGVLLEFDWAPFVNGVGGRSGISGTATWNTANGGFSTITLSNSVAEWWPGAASKALVAHEVGHAITSKCHEMFDSADQAANEAWATAWAISMGHTNDGNGVQAYGYPPQELIEKAATCR